MKQTNSPPPPLPSSPQVNVSPRGSPVNLLLGQEKSERGIEFFKYIPQL